MDEDKKFDDVKEPWDAFRGTKEYARFKKDPAEQYKQTPLINIQYSLVDFCGQSCIKNSEFAKFKIKADLKSYRDAIMPHKNHSKYLLGFNPRNHSGHVFVCMMCLNCFEISGVPLFHVQKNMEDFRKLNKEIFEAFTVKFDWRDMPREMKKSDFDYNGAVNHLVDLFDPED